MKIWVVMCTICWTSVPMFIYNDFHCISPNSVFIGIGCLQFQYFYNCNIFHWYFQNTVHVKIFPERWDRFSQQLGHEVSGNMPILQNATDLHQVLSKKMKIYYILHWFTIFEQLIASPSLDHHPFSISQIRPILTIS